MVLNTQQRKMPEPKEQEVTDGWKKLYNYIKCAYKVLELEINGRAEMA
jgi:hypothetical protein